MADSKMNGTEPLHPLGELYAHWALNPLVDLAYVVSYDVVVRPQHYPDLSDDVAAILNDFRFKLGTDPAWPNAFQRTLSFKVLYQVNLASPPLRETALRFRQDRDDATDRGHLSATREAVSDFRAQMAPLEGGALTLIYNQTRPIFERTVTVLRDPAVARAFGLPPPPEDGWPDRGNFSGAGARLIAEMSNGLRNVASLAGAYRRLGADRADRPLMPLFTVSLPEHKVLALQRAAYYGSRTLSSVLLGEGMDADVLDGACRWTSALQTLLPDVARAWKDPDYRSRLTDLEWGMAPNPAGDATPLIPQQDSVSTHTVHGEICCCSGDLDCVPETWGWFCGTMPE